MPAASQESPIVHPAQQYDTTSSGCDGLAAFAVGMLLAFAGVEEGAG